MILNEIKLKRYGFTEYPYGNDFRNFYLGGVSILYPMKNSLKFSFNDNLAIELRNLEFEGNYVIKTQINVN